MKKPPASRPKAARVFALFLFCELSEPRPPAWVPKARAALAAPGVTTIAWKFLDFSQQSIGSSNADNREALPQSIQRI